MSERPEGFAVVPRYLWYDGEIPLVERALLVSLTARVGKDCTCWPSAATLGKELGCHPKTVRRAVQSLVKRGLVSVTSRSNPDGGQTSNSYRILFSPFGEEG